MKVKNKKENKTKKKKKLSNCFQMVRIENLFHPSVAPAHINMMMIMWRSRLVSTIIVLSIRSDQQYYKLSALQCTAITSM